MWDLWRHIKFKKIFLDKSVGGEYNFFGQLWRVYVFFMFLGFVELLWRSLKTP